MSKEAITCFGNSIRQLEAVNVYITQDTSRLLGRRPTSLTSEWNMIRGASGEDERRKWSLSLASPGPPVGQLCVTHASQLPIQELKIKTAPNTGDEELSFGYSLHEILYLCLSPTPAKLVRRLRYSLFVFDSIQNTSSSQNR